MALIEINTEPSKKDLVWFGVLFAVFFGVIGTLLTYRWGMPEVGRIVWMVAGAVLAAYAIIPPLRKPIYLGWIYATLPIGFVVSHTILFITYFGVITPIGLAMRAAGRDPMTRELDKSATSYWRSRPRDVDPKRYFRQF